MRRTDELNEAKEGNIADNQTINISFAQKSEEYYAGNRTLLLRERATIPVVDIAGNEAASDAINRYVSTFDIQGMSVEEARKWAEEDYKARGQVNWYGYEMETSYFSERADYAVISFLIDAYSYMGGAHPNSVEAALNFDPQTGKRLTLADVTIDERTAVRGITEAILEQTKQEKYKDMLFEGYESSVGDLLTEDTWYLGKDGFHIIGNEYIISPHAAGILDFVIPYEKAVFLKDKYRIL
ncbi:MAG: DUF3298 and DUF4163 domain-containing protein [Clostridiales bacterium]|nr:DUF3298 and DUF4163 domain-containing protein [Clostridiales bacterium]